MDAGADLIKLFSSELVKYFVANALEQCIDSHAIRYLFLSASQGDSDSQNNLGCYFANGIGVLKDEIEAVRYYRLSADQGNSDAQHNLGVCFANGFGVEKDVAEAVRYYRLSADQGNSDAQHNLGVCFANGIGVEKDEVEAVRYYRLSANQGDGDAQHSLGCCFDNGIGVEKDEVEAVRYYRMSADQGNSDAQNNLGVCYANGFGVEKDIAEAVRYYRMSADQGNSDALYNLGCFYANGIGVTKDELEADRCFRIANEIKICQLESDEYNSVNENSVVDYPNDATNDCIATDGNSISQSVETEENSISVSVKDSATNDIADESVLESSYNIDQKSESNKLQKKHNKLNKRNKAGSKSNPGNFNFLCFYWSSYFILFYVGKKASIASIDNQLKQHNRKSVKSAPKSIKTKVTSGFPQNKKHGMVQENKLANPKLLSFAEVLSTLRPPDLRPSPDIRPSDVELLGETVHFSEIITVDADLVDHQEESLPEHCTNHTDSTRHVENADISNSNKSAIEVSPIDTETSATVYYDLLSAQNKLVVSFAEDSNNNKSIADLALLQAEHERVLKENKRLYDLLRMSASSPLAQLSGDTANISNTIALYEKDIDMNNQSPISRPKTSPHKSALSSSGRNRSHSDANFNGPTNSRSPSPKSRSGSPSRNQLQDFSKV